MPYLKPSKSVGIKRNSGVGVIEDLELQPRRLGHVYQVLNWGQYAGLRHLLEGTTICFVVHFTLHTHLTYRADLDCTLPPFYAHR